MTTETQQSIVVGSTNPVKLQATEQGFAAMFPQSTFVATGLAVPSGVSPQPMSRVETLRGARQRAANAAQAQPNATFAVGIEGGLEIVDGRVECFAWVVVQSAEQIGEGQTGVFRLPREVTRLIIDEGLELGEADDRIFQRDNSKQQTGSIGLLTGDVLTRTTYYVPAVIMALIPFKNPQFTWP